MRTTPLGVCASAALLRNTPTQNRPIKDEYRIDASLKGVQTMAYFAVSVTEPIAKSECHRLDRQVPALDIADSLKSLSTIRVELRRLPAATFLLFPAGRARPRIPGRRCRRRSSRPCHSRRIARPACWQTAGRGMQ